MPVLVLAGGKPILYKSPERFVAAAKRALPHAQVDLVPETGHSMNVEKAEEVNRRVLMFLKDSKLQEEPLGEGVYEV